MNTLRQGTFKVVAALPSKLPMGNCLLVAVRDNGPSQTLEVAEL